MSDTRSHVILRYMKFDDIDQVVELDHLSFTNPWPARAYRYELTDQSRSKMFVLEQGGVTRQSNGTRPQYWLRWITGRSVVTGAPLVGYCGYWKVVDEAHISTIAVHPDWRGKKLGELMVWSMIRQAIRDEAAKITLEVRISNSVAQSLYRKYGFVVAGRRKRYYRDNNEDAYTMALMSLHEQTYRDMLVKYGRELAGLLRVTDRI